MFQLTYDASVSQLKHLRLSSDMVRQNMTYHCKNSYAHKDKNGVIMSYIKLMTSDDMELTTTSGRRNRLDVKEDKCTKKDNTWNQADFEFTTKWTAKLPIADIAVFDVNGKNEEFGLDVGPVCFS